MKRSWTSLIHVCEPECGNAIVHGVVALVKKCLKKLPFVLEYYVGVPDQEALGWFPLGWDLVLEDNPFRIFFYVYGASRHSQLIILQITLAEELAVQLRNLPLNTSLNSPGGAFLMKLEAIRTYRNNKCQSDKRVSSLHKLHVHVPIVHIHHKVYRVAGYLSVSVILESWKWSASEQV